MTETLQARKRQLVQDLIWGAGIDLFADKGYDETTIEQIVQAAGVSQRSFFRYFASKSELMAHAMASYADAIVVAIEACPRSDTAAQVLHHTVLEVARGSIAHPRTRKTMAVLKRYPAARAAEVSRLPEVQDRVAEAFAKRQTRELKNGLAPRILAGLTLQLLGVTLQSWFDDPRSDIERTVEEAIGTTRRLIGDGPAKNPRAPKAAKREG